MPDLFLSISEHENLQIRRPVVAHGMRFERIGFHQNRAAALEGAALQRRSFTVIPEECPPVAMQDYEHLAPLNVVVIAANHPGTNGRDMTLGDVPEGEVYGVAGAAGVNPHRKPGDPDRHGRDWMGSDWESQLNGRR
jgi:hypothetical protein